MRGHQNLIQLRQRGLKPSGMVWLADYPVQPRFLRWDYPEDGQNPKVCTDGDAMESIDLRFVVGLRVNIHGDDMRRVRLLAQKARKAGAEMVVCMAGERAAIWKKGDAEWLSF